LSSVNDVLGSVVSPRTIPTAAFSMILSDTSAATGKLVDTLSSLNSDEKSTARG